MILACCVLRQILTFFADFSTALVLSIPFSVGGTVVQKMTPVLKEKRENGYREEKMTPVPKEKRENGYRAEKMYYVP